MVKFMYAIIETGGKQYKVEQGDSIYIEKLAEEEKSTVDFKVIAIGNDSGLTVGNPYVEGATVTGEVIKNGKGKKITISTYKRRKGYKRKLGHRQPYTKVEVKSING